MDVKAQNHFFRSGTLISPTAEYALRAMVAIAQADPEPLVTSAMAASTKVPPGYLPKVLQTLRKAGLVESKRGLNGGFNLARSSEGISILDVINAVDPLKRIERCPLGLKQHATHLCPLHRRLDEAIAVAERSFGLTTMAELLSSAGNRSVLCPDEDPRRGPFSVPVPLEVD